MNKRRIKWIIASTCLFIIAVVVVYYIAILPKLGAGNGPTTPDGVSGLDQDMASYAVYPYYADLTDLATATCNELTETEAYNVEGLNYHHPTYVVKGYRFKNASLYETTMVDGTKYYMLRITYTTGTGAMTDHGDYVIQIMNYEPKQEDFILELETIPNDISGFFVVKCYDFFVGMERGDLDYDEMIKVLESIGDSNSELPATTESLIQETSNLQNDGIPDSRKNLLFGDIPDGTVAVVFTPTQPNIGNIYIPDNQDEWKSAITGVMNHLQDKEYDVFPDADMKPIQFFWVHDGIEDRWTLGNDGSLWGDHLIPEGSVPFTNNYIAPEDGSELAKLMMQAYDYLKISPVKNDQIVDIVRAELIIKDKSYVLDDPEGIKKLEETLKNGSRQGGTGCYFVLLKLYKSDGQTIDIAIAADGCAVWHSDGVFYKYGGSDASQKLFNLFGIDLPLATFVDR